MALTEGPVADYRAFVVSGHCRAGQTAAPGSLLPAWRPGWGSHSRSSSEKKAVMRRRNRPAASVCTQSWVHTFPLVNQGFRRSETLHCTQPDFHLGTAFCLVREGFACFVPNVPKYLRSVYAPALAELRIAGMAHTRFVSCNASKKAGYVGYTSPKVLVYQEKSRTQAAVAAGYMYPASGYMGTRGTSPPLSLTKSEGGSPQPAGADLPLREASSASIWRSM